MNIAIKTTMSALLLVTACQVVAAENIKACPSLQNMQATQNLYHLYEFIAQDMSHLPPDLYRDFGLSPENRIGTCIFSGPNVDNDNQQSFKSYISTSCYEKQISETTDRINHTNLSQVLRLPEAIYATVEDNTKQVCVYSEYKPDGVVMESGPFVYTVEA